MQHRVFCSANIHVNRQPPLCNFWIPRNARDDSSRRAPDSTTLRFEGQGSTTGGHARRSFSEGGGENANRTPSILCDKTHLVLSYTLISQKIPSGVKKCIRNIRLASGFTSTLGASHFDKIYILRQRRNSGPSRLKIFNIRQLYRQILLRHGIPTGCPLGRIFNF